MNTALPGRSFPLGATPDADGTNFAVYSEHAEQISVVLFGDDGTQTGEWDLADVERFVFHGRIPGVAPGQRYGLRVNGPYAPARGVRCNPSKLLLDPYARAIAGRVGWGPAVLGYDGSDAIPSGLDSAAAMPRCLVIDDSFDWHDDRRPGTEWADTVIYELNVRSFTRLHPALPEQLRGTYAGLAHPAVVEHLRSLGITAVELMPVHAFVDTARLAAMGLRNLWGYDTVGYFAPEARYSASGDGGGQVSEFKEMVRVLHAAGLEVILDVVYNHTGESDVLGPTLEFRGLDNPTYYHLDETDPSRYLDVTGCGNTLNAGHPQTLQLIMDSLRYWVSEMHVDGFRFDLASALARQYRRAEMVSGFFDIVHQDPTLSHVKLIAEPWDLGDGGYQVGNFPLRWAEWNGRFRDTVRDFWRSAPVGVADLAYRLSGSSDLYQDDGRSPSASINFVTCHDGFTLSDLVSYDTKHNQANGEGNRDGTDDNRSWNCGSEGPSADPAIGALRDRQRRNLIATVLLSQGSPMLQGADALSHSQRGNNNAYCQDNEISWLDWTTIDSSFLEWVTGLVRLRQAEPVLRRRHFFTGALEPGLQRKDIVWIDEDGGEMDVQRWQDPAQSSLGMILNGDAIPDRRPDGSPLRGATLLVLLHGGSGPIRWVLPGGWGRGWDLVLGSWEGAATGPAPAVLPMPDHALAVLRALPQ